jgi:phage-related protein
MKSASDISRICHFASVGKNIVLLHGFVKKAKRTPNREIETANSYVEDYQRRNQT